MFTVAAFGLIAIMSTLALFGMYLTDVIDFGCNGAPIEFISRSEWNAQPPDNEPLPKLEIPAAHVIIAHTSMIENCFKMLTNITSLIKYIN